MVNAYYFIKASCVAGFFVPLKHSTPLNIVGYFIFFYFDVGGEKKIFFLRTSKAVKEIYF